MSDLPASHARSRQPSQERSAARMAKVIAATEQLIAQLGPEKTSIPAIAEAAQVPRAAIYPFFPDKYALFSHIARQHMDQLLALLSTTSQQASSLDWRAEIQALVEASVDYYNRHPVASILLLRDTWTEADREAHAAKNRAISRHVRQRLQGLTELPTAPDSAVLAIEIAFACMKHGYAEEEWISPAISREACRAAQTYLAQWEQPR